MSRLLNFAAGLERVYDPFLFPVLGTKESIKKGKTIFAIQLAVYIYQKYIQCRFIYLFVLYSEISDRFPENGGNRYGSAPGSYMYLTLSSITIDCCGVTLRILEILLYRQSYRLLSSMFMLIPPLSVLAPHDLNLPKFTCCLFCVMYTFVNWLLQTFLALIN